MKWNWVKNREPHLQVHDSVWGISLFQHTGTQSFSFPFSQSSLQHVLYYFFSGRNHNPCRHGWYPERPEIRRQYGKQYKSFQCIDRLLGRYLAYVSLFQIYQVIDSSALSSVLCALPWFFIEKRRPGLDLPPGTSLLTVGFTQLYVAFRECRQLKQTLLYLIFYFLMWVSSDRSLIFSFFHQDMMVGGTSWTQLGRLPSERSATTFIKVILNQDCYRNLTKQVDSWDCSTMMKRWSLLSVVKYSTLELTLLRIVGVAAQGLGF